MNEAELTRIIEEVTKKVMLSLQSASEDDGAATEGYAKVLVIGQASDPIPEPLQKDAVLLDIDDYREHKNILRYQKIVISSINITQLADLAQGRIADDVTCAVLHGLLNGIDVVMLDEALSYRRFAGKGSTALYNLLESYAQTLQVFGVKTLNTQLKLPVVPEAKTPKFRTPAVKAPKSTATPNFGLLITESDAQTLLQQSKIVHLPVNAIITPSAWDVFVQAGAQVHKGS